MLLVQQAYAFMKLIGKGKIKGEIMKIIVKQTNWSGWNGGSSDETIHEYEVRLKEEIVVDSREYSTYENGKDISYVETIFSFKVVKITNKYIKIVTNGEAGGVYSNFRRKFKPKKSVLYYNQTISFDTNWKDAGKIFEISIG